MPTENQDQKFEAFERDYVMNQEESSSQEVDQGYYFIEVVDMLSPNIFSDEYIKRNSPLLTEMTNEFYLMDVETNVAARFLETFFRSILIHGLR